MTLPAHRGRIPAHGDPVQGLPGPGLPDRGGGLRPGLGGLPLRRRRLRGAPGGRPPATWSGCWRSAGGRRWTCSCRPWTRNWPLCGEHRARFEALGTRLLLSGPRALAVCADKLRMYECFRDLGIPTPRTVAAEDYREGVFRALPAHRQAPFRRGAAPACTWPGTTPRPPSSPGYVERRGGAGAPGRGVEYTIDALAGLDGELRILSPRQRLATESGDLLQGRSPTGGRTCWRRCGPWCGPWRWPGR